MVQIQQGFREESLTLESGWGLAVTSVHSKTKQTVMERDDLDGGHPSVPNTVLNLFLLIFSNPDSNTVTSRM